MTATRVYLVRHGETELSAEDCFAGETDVPLSDRGRDQLHSLAERLAEEPIAAVYASPLSRTMETARILAQPHGKPVTPREGLREISHGRWEGKRRAEVERLFPEEYARWEADPYSFAPTGGETGLAVTARALPALLEIVSAHPGERVLVASHKATIRLLIGSLLGFDLRRYRDNLDQSPASLNILDFRDLAHARLSLFNDTSHSTAAPRRAPRRSRRIASRAGGARPRSRPRGEGPTCVSRTFVPLCAASWPADLAARDPRRPEGRRKQNVGLAGESSVPLQQPSRRHFLEEDSVPFSQFGLHPDLLRGVRELGFTRPDADPGRRHSARPRGPRRARLRDDRQRQDRRVPAADPAPADRQAARHDARARPHADARAGGADPRGRDGAGRAHADHRRGRLRRRRHGPAGARLPQRRRRHRRHAGPAARSLSAARTRSSPGSRSSCSTRRTACSTWASCPTSGASLRHLPARAPDAVLQRDDAAADRRS